MFNKLFSKRRAKPILIIGMPTMHTEEEFVIVKQRILNDITKEYHVLIYTDFALKSITFNVFNGKNLSETEFNELKSFVDIDLDLDE